MMTRLLLLGALLLLLPQRSHAQCSDPADLGIDLSQQADCDPIVPEKCLLPEPNDYFTVADPTSRTGRCVAFTAAGVPHNQMGTPMDIVELNRFDGFSPGSALLAWMPNVDLALSGAPSLTDIGASLEPDSPVVVIDAKNGRRWPVWAEVDMHSPANNRALIVRPATNFLEGHRYIIALRGMVDGLGSPIPTSPAFVAYRDGTCTTDATFESRRQHMEDLFGVLRRAGVARADVQVAWDFTIATADTIAHRMLHIRDDAFAVLGMAAPVFHVTDVIENPAPE